MTVPLSPLVRFRVGAWIADLAAHTLQEGDRTLRLDAATLDVLAVLAEQPGVTIAVDTLRDRLWPFPGGTDHLPELRAHLATLHQLLGPALAATPDGYRLAAPVTREDEGAAAGTDIQPALEVLQDPHVRHVIAWGAVLAVGVMLLIVWLAYL